MGACCHNISSDVDVIENVYLWYMVCVFLNCEFMMAMLTLSALYIKIKKLFALCLGLCYSASMCYRNAPFGSEVSNDSCPEKGVNVEHNFQPFVRALDKNLAVGKRINSTNIICG